MVRHLGRPAYCTEIDGIEVLELLEPVSRHHAAVLEVVVAIRPVEGGELQIDAELAGGGLDGAQAFRHDFLAYAVSGDDSDFMSLHVVFSFFHGGGRSWRALHGKEHSACRPVDNPALCVVTDHAT